MMLNDASYWSPSFLTESGKSAGESMESNDRTQVDYRSVLVDCCSHL